MKKDLSSSYLYYTKTHLGYTDTLILSEDTYFTPKWIITLHINTPMWIHDTHLD